MNQTRRQFAANMAIASLATSLGLPSSTATDPPAASGSIRYTIWFWKNSWVKWYGTAETPALAAQLGAAEADALREAGGTHWQDAGKIEVRHLAAEGGVSSGKIRSQIGNVTVQTTANGYKYGVIINAVKYNKKPDGMPLDHMGIEDFDDLFNTEPSPTSW